MKYKVRVAEMMVETEGDYFFIDDAGHLSVCEDGAKRVSSFAAGFWIYIASVPL